MAHFPETNWIGIVINRGMPCVSLRRRQAGPEPHWPPRVPTGTFAFPEAVFVRLPRGEAQLPGIELKEAAHSFEVDSRFQILGELAGDPGRLVWRAACGS